MTQIESLFATRLYRAALSEHGPKIDADELETSCIVIANDDEAGQDWCEENAYPGYTSYASLSDLPWRFPIFADLVKVLDRHVAEFAKDLQFDLDIKDLVKQTFLRTALWSRCFDCSKIEMMPLGSFRVLASRTLQGKSYMFQRKTPSESKAKWRV